MDSVGKKEYRMFHLSLFPLYPLNLHLGFLFLPCNRSYRELMKEYSLSAVMADWLSFEDNTSLQYNIDVNGVKNMPDENVSI